MIGQEQTSWTRALCVSRASTVVGRSRPERLEQTIRLAPTPSLTSFGPCSSTSHLPRRTGCDDRTCPHTPHPHHVRRGRQRLALAVLPAAGPRPPPPPPGRPRGGP